MTGLSAAQIAYNERRAAAKNPKASTERGRRWRQKNQRKLRDLTVRYRYGITLAQQESMLVEQGGRCKICESDNPGWHGSWCVDHCHKTGVVRGLLCHTCNLALGAFKDDPAVIDRAAAYLRSPRGQSV